MEKDKNRTVSSRQESPLVKPHNQTDHQQQQLCSSLCPDVDVEYWFSASVPCLQSRGTTTNTKHTKHGNKHAAQSQHKDSIITSTNRQNNTIMCN